MELNKDNTYIMNMEGAYIYKDIVEGEKTTSKGKDLAKLFTATMPFSLESLRMEQMFDDVYYEVNGKRYTKCILNVCFDKDYTKWEDRINEETGEVKRVKIATVKKKKIRKKLYLEGFYIDGQHYVFYKRGSAKAKNGFALFILEEMRDKLIERSRLWVNFEEDEEVDLTSLRAYESLISSGLVDVIDIKPHEILIIDDIYGVEFKSKANVTREINGVMETKDEIIDIQNCLSDGQALADEELFKRCGHPEKGMMLLRNDFLKSCAFNTKLQKFWRENGITELIDMFGNKHRAEDIKLVITPNSLKFLKFAYKIGDGSKAECYKYWCEHIDSTFGIVKYDKEGNFGTYNRTTYQLLNSMPYLTKEDLMDITQEERDFVMLLKNDDAVFRHYIGKDAVASLKLEEQLESDEEITMLENTELLSALLLVNSDIQYTKKFKKLKSDLISNYVSHLKMGKIRVKDSKYTTLISNPYEMLLATIGKFNGKSIMQGREVYCKYYKDGQEFCISRNPHINAGNVMWGKNVYHEEYDKWFNFTDNISCVNFFDNDMPDRLQGCDTDSDTFLTLVHPVLVKNAKVCEKEFATPVNKVEGTSVPKKNNMIEQCNMDVALSDNYIGKIVNMSQIFNSYLNDAIYRNAPKEEIDSLYNMSSRLSSMSQIEIDRSKKVFDNINMAKELKSMRNNKYIRHVQCEDENGNEYSKMVVPTFFAMVSDADKFREYEVFHTPLDILQEVLKLNYAQRRGIKNKEMKELLVKPKTLEGEYQTKGAKLIYEIVLKCGKKINSTKLKTCTLNEKAKQTVIRKAKFEAIKELKKLNPNDNTILGIIKQCFEKTGNLDFKKHGMLTLNLLFASKKKQVLKCFKKEEDDNELVLVKMKDVCDYDFFGEKYQTCVKSEIK